MESSNRGFTLVELAIVLVIIGLIVGGVLVGRDLVRTAELRTVISDIEKYTSAVHTFRNKYNALPGDMRNATDIWGAADPTPATCQTTQGIGTETCNGNGDGRVAPSGGNEDYEAFRFWQQLANAQLVGVTVTGIAGAGSTSEALTGTNIPRSRPVDSAGVDAAYLGTLADDANVFGGQYGHIFLFGGDIATSPNYLPVLSPADTLYIDTKRDDGRPGTGSVVTPKGGGAVNPNCTTAAAAAAAVYDLTHTDASCSIFFRNAF